MSSPEPLSTPEDIKALRKLLGFDLRDYRDPEPGEKVLTIGFPASAVPTPDPVGHVLDTTPIDEARLYGCLRAIMLEHGMEAAVTASARALQQVAEAARANGRKLDGFIG